MEGTAKETQQASAVSHPAYPQSKSLVSATGALSREHDDGRLRECVLSRSGYRVRLADSPGQRNQASILINSMYSWRGYATEGLELTHHNPNRITLEASTGQQLFGTLTLGLDSEDGLLAEELYPDEIGDLRKQGRKLCEMTKLAFDPQYSSKESLAALFHLAYIYAHSICKATDVLIEVNPRHVTFYQRRLGFEQMGDAPRTCPRVGAPAVLLRGRLAFGEKQISRLAGRREINDKSLYPYFFSEDEVTGLTQRILRHN